MDGSVWTSSRKTAVKALSREPNYRIEKECYQRFKAENVRNIQRFAVPELIGSNDALLVVEMRIVSPPYFLDFAKAWLDAPPEFSPETLDDWEQEGRERFEGRWPKVKSLLRALRAYGIYYYDAKPGNIMFGDEHEA